MNGSIRPFVRFYDRIYGDKDYSRDIAVFSELTGLNQLRNPKVLEIGAGTGNHTTLISKCVDRLVSVEIDPDFVQVLQAKVQDRRLANVTVAPVQLDQIPDRDFDSACALFHVLNYVDRDEMAQFVAALASKMKPDAWFLADLWNCEAVMLDPPRQEKRTKLIGETSILQEINPVFNRDALAVSLDYHISIEAPDESVRFRELLELKLWGREMLTKIFSECGFDNISFHAYADTGVPPSDASFRQWLRARKS